MSDQNSSEPVIAIEALSAETFQPFGEIIEVGTVSPILINEDRCRRYSDLAGMEFIGGQAGISLFQAELRSLPHKLTILERHPLGSQCFIPMGHSEYLVIVAEDDEGQPSVPRAFMASSTQSINIGRNTWHGVLTPIKGSGLFAVVDRIGEGKNLEEHWLKEAYLITE
ncbi:Ureidoglycolate lyase [Pseudovibrio axinellae]|uniref:Ureidoglycolate lyase n=1 Tax=Pseudovibrio axinellae TaxID=989403 RepID=A0A165YXK3_9HYPH|nr:ureidoglycolate lyase [Pseudovibrio axinellae]KZL19324.1 Ureidoglycolate lyase [Pseudovibrio axinellae]SEQ41328.1 ureidoglycolate lyase [Pseudovibrio axinellae]